MQSALEVKLARELFVAARAEGTAALNGMANGRAAPAVHAVPRSWEILTTIAKALGYSVSEGGSLQRDDEVRLCQLFSLL